MIVGEMFPVSRSRTNGVEVEGYGVFSLMLSSERE